MNSGDDRLRRRRRYGAAMVIVGGLILLSGSYLVVTALLARRQLESVRDEVRVLRAQISTGKLDAARATARQITAHASSARHYTAGPIWALAGSLPAGGAPLETVRTITSQVDVLGQRVLPEVVTASRDLDPSALRRSDGSINLARIQAVEPRLDAADSTMRRATGRIADRPESTWLGPVDTARADLLTQMRSLSKTLHSAYLAARIAPPMLGADGAKRYFVGFQNDAEARGTGGLPGAFGIVKADHGKLSIVRFESDRTLSGISSGLRFGADYDALWGRPSSSYDEYRDSNVSAHFPYAAQIWLAMWQRKTGQRLDGALAVDPTALSYLLAVTGPAQVPGGDPVTAANVVQLTQQTLYARYPNDDAQRKTVLLDVARAISEQILNFRGSTTALVKAAGAAGAQRRLLLYSTTRDTESAIDQTSASGAIEPTAGPYAGLVVNNDAGNKLDYYLERRFSWVRTGCGDQREVTVTATFTNTAPTGLAHYVIERNDHPHYRTGRGDTRLGVYYYGTKGAFLRSVTLNGTRVPTGLGAEQGHPVYVADVEIPRGATRTLVLHFLEPAGTGALTVVRQPLVRPISVSVSDQNCG